MTGEVLYETDEPVEVLDLPMVSLAEIQRCLDEIKRQMMIPKRLNNPLVMVDSYTEHTLRLP